MTVISQCAWCLVRIIRSMKIFLLIVVPSLPKYFKRYWQNSFNDTVKLEQHYMHILRQSIESIASCYRSSSFASKSIKTLNYISFVYCIYFNPAGECSGVEQTLGWLTTCNSPDLRRQKFFSSESLIIIRLPLSQPFQHPSWIFQFLSYFIRLQISSMYSPLNHL